MSFIAEFTRTAPGDRMAFQLSANGLDWMMACSTKRLLGLLIALSLSALAYEAVDISWGSYAVSDRDDRRSAENLKMFRVPMNEDEANRTTANLRANSSSRRHSNNWSEEVHPADLLHLSLLQEICLGSDHTIISWQYGAPGSGSDQNTTEDSNLILHKQNPKVLQVLKDCPDVDIFLPSGLRGHGYCEDGVAYAKYLKSRLLPKWVFTDVFRDPETGRSLTYNEICPNTPIIYFNHYWDGVHELSKDKPLYLMPNIEMYELRETHLWRADVVLCKTMSCQNRVTQWYKQEGNPRNTQVFYTKHTTSDVARFARHRLLRSNESATMKAKDFENVRFVHTAGSSSWKGTKEILQCWLSRTDLPPLDLHIGSENFKRTFKTEAAGHILSSPNIQLKREKLDAVQFGRVMAESAFFLCPSRMEGYGHYINQARAAGGVIITTQAEPMNELVPSTDMGVYVETRVGFNRKTFLGGAFNGPHGLRDVKGLVANIKSESLCAAVDEVIAMSVKERKAKAGRIQQQFRADTKYFEAAMERLGEFARLSRESSVNGSIASVTSWDILPSILRRWFYNPNTNF